MRINDDSLTESYVVKDKSEAIWIYVKFLDAFFRTILFDRI